MLATSSFRAVLRRQRDVCTLSRQGWDKTYCLKFLEDYNDIHFFGDKTYEVSGTLCLRTVGRAAAIVCVCACACVRACMRVCARMRARAADFFLLVGPAAWRHGVGHPGLHLTA